MMHLFRVGGGLEVSQCIYAFVCHKAIPTKFTPLVIMSRYRCFLYYRIPTLFHKHLHINTCDVIVIAKCHKFY